MEENKPLETDPSENPEEGREDVETKEDKAELSLDDLNELAGRKDDNAFKSRDDFMKHYKNLNSLVGDQEAIKQRKEPRTEEEIAKKVAELESKISLSEQKIAEKEFLADNPKAKDNMDIVKAYAKANDITLSEAWEKVSDKFVSSGDLVTNQRINSVKSADLDNLSKQARGGDSNAQEQYVSEMLGLK